MWKCYLIPSSVFQQILGCMNLIYLRYTNSLEDTAIFSQNIKLNRDKKSVLMQTDHGSQSILFSWHGISSYQTFRILQTLR